MVNQPPPAGVVNATPEGGPISEGTPATEPGTGQVRLTPEAGPLPEPADAVLQPPSWHEHMKGPIIGLDDRPAAASAPAEPVAAPIPPPYGGRTPEDDAELKKWPPYTGKPVSDVEGAWRYAAPVVSQAEKLAIGAVGLTGKGLTKLAGFLEQRRLERTSHDEHPRD